ncbi:Ger(x)C family spore germination protein [Tissierella carlieri]
MKRMNKIIKIMIITIYLVLASIFLSSCIAEVGGKEINRIAIVTSIGVDYEDEKVVITCEVVNPIAVSNASDAASDNPNPQGFVYPQGMGDTVREAIDDINIHFDKKIFLAHSNLLIIGEEFAQRGITDLMDFFLRDNEPREDMYIVVAKGAKAYDIIGVRAGLSRASGNYLYDILNNFPYNAKSINISFAEKYRYFYDIGNNPVIGVVQLKEVKELDIEKREKEPKKIVLDVSGGAVLRKDYIIGYFTADEMIGFNFIVNEIKGGSIVFRVPEESIKDSPIIGENGKFATVNILKSKSKNNISINNGKIHLTINVKLRGALNEINQAIDAGNSEIIYKIEKACSERIKELISITLDKGQKEFKQDNFSIGVSVHQQYPELWKEIAKNWQDIFPEISYDVNVETTIVKIGLINTPANVRKGR